MLAMNSLPPPAQASIFIRRTAADDVQQRQVIVKLDGHRVAQLLYGQSVTIPTTSGPHHLTVDNTWNRKSLELALAPGERRAFSIANRRGTFSWFLIGILGAAPLYVSIEPSSEQDPEPNAEQNAGATV